MNWLTNFVRPRLAKLVGKDIPDNLWHKCPACEQMLFHRDLQDNLNVCRHCGHHLRLSVTERLALMFDQGQYTRLPVVIAPHDPLRFRDLKKYSDRLKDARSQTKEDDAVVVAEGRIGGHVTVVAVLNFDFMGGSMGVTVGNGLLTAADAAVASKAALIVVPASGGARMQEGILSLMQMPRTTVAVTRVKEAGLPYIALLTDPTMGGVSASFAMLGDLTLAEPGATVGFAGARVIQQTIRGTLPAGFQKAEFLLEHGMVDLVVNRADLKERLKQVLDHLMPSKKRR